MLYNFYNENVLYHFSEKNAMFSVSPFTSQMRNSDSAESQPWLGPQLTVKAAPPAVFLKAHESVLLGTAASVATPTSPDMDKTELVVPEGSTRATRSWFQVWLETLPSHGYSSGLRVGPGI